jgi:phosphocarrier protein HPr
MNTPTQTNTTSTNELRKEMQIINDLGLHARASAKLVEIANRFENTEIEIHYLEKSANCKSIMGVMMLAAKKNAKVEIIAKGDHAQAALQAIHDLINNCFGEPQPS